ncbi:MAG TPA: hypothetical protein VGF67_03400 [Ktedonobacteraceae bacterium]
MDAGRAPKAERFLAYLKGWRVPLGLLLAGVIFCEASWIVFLTPGEQDIAHYECYGLTFWLGSHGTALLPHATCAYLFQGTSAAPSPLPFHMLPIEYPSLSVLPFSLPLLAPLPCYALAFVLMMTLVAGLIYWLLACSDAWRAAPIFLFYLLLGTVGLFQERFDLLPATCTLICVLAARRGHWRVAYIALALGGLLKLYPFVMLPALLLDEQRQWPAQRANPDTDRPGLAWAWSKARRWHNCLLFTALLSVVTGGFALLNVQDALISPFHYFLARPIQIESLAGSVLWSASHMGVPYTIDFTFGSLNLESQLSLLLSPLDTALLLCGILFLLWLQWKRRIDLLEAMVGLLCVLIATGKVFSPQYLLWLLPLLAYLYACGKTSRAWMCCWAMISLLTTCIYALYYSRLTDPQLDPQIVQTFGGFFELVMLRNVLLLGTTIAFLGGWWGVRQAERQACQSSG